jgi:hypothetical protein
VKIADLLHPRNREPRSDDLIHIVHTPDPHRTLCGLEVEDRDLVHGAPTGAANECVVCVDIDRGSGPGPWK